jgi:hypothetical protein
MLKDWQILLLIPALSLLGLVVANRLIRFLERHHTSFDYDADVIDTATGNTISGAFVILSFSFVLVMGNADRFDTDASREASQIHVLDRMLSLNLSTNALALRHDLLAYTESVARDEWPTLGNDSNSGRGNPTTSACLDRFLNGIKTLQNGDGDGSQLFPAIVRQSGDVIESRDLRLLNASTHLPSLFWIVNIVSLVVVIIVSALRLIQPSLSRVIVIAAQVIIINMLFSAVLILDNPFKGQTRIMTQPLERVILKIQDSIDAPLSGHAAQESSLPQR